MTWDDDFYEDDFDDDDLPGDDVAPDEFDEQTEHRDNLGGTGGIFG